jgi:hypothetical protein
LTKVTSIPPLAARNASRSGAGDVAWGGRERAKQEQEGVRGLRSQMQPPELSNELKFVRICY